MKKTFKYLIIAVFFISTTVSAQHEDFDQSSWIMPKDSIALKAAKLLDVREGKLLSDAVVISRTEL